MHASCILYNCTLATFLPPLSYSTLYTWWEDRLREVTAGGRHIIVFLSKVSSRTAGKEQEVRPPFESEGIDWPIVYPSSSSVESNPISHPSSALEVSGVVSLTTPFSQTGPFRGQVEKLFVSPLHRRKGIARRIMTKLEAVALEHGRWNLMLDTELGSEAESVYPRLGYTRLGVVKEYGYSPEDGRLVDEVWFWKDLRKGKLT